MKNEGKKFEEDFINSFPADIFAYRLRDSSGGWGGDGKKTRFTTTNSCDFIVFTGQSLLMLELKSTQQVSLPFSNIKKSQLNGLQKDANKINVNAYFVINFRTTEETYAVSALKIIEFIDNQNRKSIPIQFCKENGILIPQTKKRIRYTYDISPLM